MEWFADITPLLTVGVLTALAAGLGAGLGAAACALRVEEDPVVERINELLPQTQCGQCGYPGCLPYARAVAAGEAINKCPPGGASTVNALAELLGTEPVPLDPAHGTEQQPTVAFIREAECIGCAKCLQACPVDAIVGAPQRMHTVIASECTGCDLCLDPCPVDCIDMLPVGGPEQAWQWPLPGEAPGPHQDLIASDRPTGVSPL